MSDILLMIILLIIIFIFIITLSKIRLEVKWIKTDNDYDGCIKILILKKIKIRTISFKTDNDKNEKESGKKRDFKKLIGLVKECAGDIKIFLHSLYDAVSITKLENHLILGFSDYAKTGEYIGYIWAISSVLNTGLPNTYLTAEPSFKGEVVNFKGMAKIDISIIKLIHATVRLLLNKNIRKLIKSVLNG